MALIAQRDTDQMRRLPALRDFAMILLLTAVVGAVFAGAAYVVSQLLIGMLQ